MLHYLGDHILMLMSMNLRDYLRLKVEIQGTSGEGSKAVKSFRSALHALHALLHFCLLCCMPPHACLLCCNLVAVPVIWQCTIMLVSCHAEKNFFWV